jgi:hypothetical protein
MHQVLHIFRKDCRQFWPEILTVLVVTAAFIWVYPFQWLSPDDTDLPSGHGFFDLTHLQILADVVTGLLPISWFFLTARVVHAENLIGTRQFWVTRPYDWKKLLAEKFFFLVVFLYLPFAAAQLALLARAGFSPFYYLPGLFFNLLLLTGICVLPFLAFAAVVSSIPRMLLVLLAFGVIVCIVAFVVTSLHTQSNSIDLPYSDRLSIPLVLAICTAALVAQYSGRHLWLARTLLISLIATITLVGVNPLEPFLFQHFYPIMSAGQAFPIEMSIAPGAKGRVSAISEEHQKVSLGIPIQILGMQRGDAVSVDDISVTLESPNGSKITAPWNAVYNERFVPGAENSVLSATVDSRSFDQLRSGPVTLYVSLAVTELKADAAVSIPLSTSGDFSLPRIGICNFAGPEGFSSATLHCRLAWGQPHLTQVSAPASNTPCTQGQPAVKTDARFSSWVGELDPDPADFGLTPVWTTNIGFEGTGGSMLLEASERRHQLYICGGSPLLLTSYHTVRRFRYEFTVHNVSLVEPKSRGILGE